MSTPARCGRGWLVALALVAGVVATYAEVGSFGWVRYDDPEYVLENPPVRAGLTLAGLRWAMTAAHSSNWHPLTWFAHMLDVQIYGVTPAGHHWSSVILHALASVLCFLALRALTGRALAAALVAGLFALHPLRVESVAWISERKDVLSGCAFFALLLAYARYVRAPSAGRYALVALCLVLGLMAKPMLVTAPCVLLLLDVWPLGRIRARRAWLEKLPLLALSGLSAVATVWSQRAGGAVQELELIPLSARLANAPVAVLRYLGHALAPLDLAYFYPHRALVEPEAPPWNAAAIVASVVVLGACVVAFRLRRAVPAALVGWAWFLGMIVPVIGIVQVGEQALADRYAYLPLVGIQIALVFGLAELAERRRALARPMLAAAALALVACGVASARQARHWRDSEALFRRAVAVTDGNYAAWCGLGNEIAEHSDAAGARGAYEHSLAVRPDYGPALYGLGLLLQRGGDERGALALYRRACDAMPRFAEAHLNRGMLLARSGDAVAAALAFEHVLELVPTHPDAHFDLAQLLAFHDRPAEAVEHLEAAVAARATFTVAWERLGALRLALGERAAARAALEHAVEDPARHEAAVLLAWILASAPEVELRDPPRALELARRAVQASGRRDPAALEALAAAFAALGQPERAVEVQDEALRLAPPERRARTQARLERYRRGELCWFGDE